MQVDLAQGGALPAVNGISLIAAIPEVAQSRNSASRNSATFPAST